MKKDFHKIAKKKTGTQEFIRGFPCFHGTAALVGYWNFPSFFGSEVLAWKKIL